MSVSERRALVETLMGQRMSNRGIAKETGYSLDTINKDVKAIRRETSVQQILDRYPPQAGPNEPMMGRCYGATYDGKNSNSHYNEAFANQLGWFSEHLRWAATLNDLVGQ